MIFRGQGAARLIAVSTSIASRITASVPRRDRIRVQIKRSIELDSTLLPRNVMK
jgi:hypothetical protein